MLQFEQISHALFADCTLGGSDVIIYDYLISYLSTTWRSRSQVISFSYQIIINAKQIKTMIHHRHAVSDQKEDGLRSVDMCSET